MGEVFFVVSNFLAVLVSVFAAEMFMSGRGPWRRLLAIVGGFGVVVMGVVLILGSAGTLWAGAAVVLLGIITLVFEVARRAYYTKTDLSVGDVGAGSELGGVWKLKVGLCLLVAGVFVGLVAGRFALPGAFFNVDDLGYHAPVVGHWVADRHLSLAPLNYHAYYPFNAELVSLWFVLPFGSDGFAGLAGLYWAALAFVATAAICSAQGHSRFTTVLAGVLVLASTVVKGSVKSFAGVDVAGASLLLAALAFSMPGKGWLSGRSRLADAGYCGLLAGLAAGCKVSLAPVTIILFLWWFLGRRTALKLSDRVKAAVVFSVCAAAAGSYWYVRTMVLTGNPLFPAEFGPLAGPFGSEQQYRTKLISWITAAPGNWNQWLYLVKSHSTWPVSLCALSVVGYVAAIVRRGLGKGSAGSGQAGGAKLLLVVGLALLALYPLMPFSGTNNSPNAQLRIAPRFLIGPFAIGIILFARLMTGGKRRILFWVLAAVAGIMPYGGGRHVNVAVNTAINVIVLAGAGLAVYLWQKFVKEFCFVRVQRAAVFLFLPAALCGLAVCQSRQQELTDHRICNYGDKHHPVGAGWRGLEALPDGARIAWFGPAGYQYYPIFGRRLQFVPCALRIDGLSYEPLHERWLRDPAQTAWWSKGRGVIDLNRLVENLVTNGVDYIFVTKWRSDKWPQQQDVLGSSQKVRKIYNDGYSAIWQIGDFAKSEQANGVNVN